jgi:hypothetical protein
VEKSLRYNPQPPIYYRQVLMSAQFLAGDYVSALENLRRVEGSLRPPSRFVAIAILQVTGGNEEADTEVDALLTNCPDTSIQSAASMFACYKNSAQVESLLNALRDAGLPEEAGGKPSNAP